ncbi:MAG: hypothetical protein N2203_06150 [Bacteroidia bacterium]|nr:hypothetical protein [Bacteroidia bacterium]
MKKVFALLAISGITAFYACSNAEKKEETTEQTTTEQTQQTTAPADSTAAPADTAHHAEGQH